MSQPALTHLDSDGGWEALLAAVPAAPGVGQFLAEADHNLCIGRAANLRRWAASYLGAGRPSRKGSRPRTDLRPVARALRFARSTSAFHQLWLYERLMATQLPVSARPDLRLPAYLHLDPEERFPRLAVLSSPASGRLLFGPFRDTRSATRAADALAKRFRLRPCEASFEPEPSLPLGLRCVYAQVRSCTAPCLERVSQAEYQAQVGPVLALLASSTGRGEEWGSLIPPWVSVVSARGLAIEPVGECLELYPILGGAVLDEQVQSATTDKLGETLPRLRWARSQTAGDDWPWLLPWLMSKQRSGAFLVLAEGLAPEDQLRRVLAESTPPPAVAHTGE